MESTEILVDLFIMFLAAKVVGEVFQRLRQPVVVGELLAGVALGAVGLIGHSVFNENLAQMGAVVLLFYVGLETRASDIFAVGRSALLVAVLGVIAPFALGYSVTQLLGWNSIEALFIGTAMVATSVGITARVMSDAGVISSQVARVILGAAIIDDVLGMLALGVVGSIGSGELSIPTIALATGEALVFTVFVALVGTRFVRRYGSVLGLLRLRNAPMAVAILICLGLAVLASYIGLAAIIGAFLAGMMLAETQDQYELEHKVQPLYDFLVPFFFVVMGTQVDLAIFLNANIVGMALVITALAVIGKLFACSIGAWSMGLRRALAVGVGMVPRGEVGVIVAMLGLTLGVVTNQTYSIVVFMSVATTLVVPPVLKSLMAQESEMALSAEK